MGLCSSATHNKHIKSNLKKTKTERKKVNFSQKITIKQNLTKTKSNSNIEFNEVKLYSFKNYKIFNNNIQFQKKPYGLQKYSFLIYDIACHGLNSPSNIYTIQISFTNYDKNIIETKEGSNPKFKLNEYLELNLTFDLLLKSYMEIELFTLKRDSKRKMSDNNNNNNIKTKNLTFYSHIKFDLLTLIIGPQLYDVTLYSNDGQIKKGRISFKLKSKFINEVHAIAKNFRTVLFKNKFPYKLSDYIIIDFNDNIWKEEKLKHSTLFFTKIKEDENNIEYYNKEFADQNFVYPLTIFDVNFSNPIFYVFTEKIEHSKIYEISGHSPTDSNPNEIFNECRLQMNRFMNIILRSKYNENYTMKTPKIEYKMVYNIQTEFQKKIKIPIFWEKENRGFFEWEIILNNLPLMRQFHYGLFTDLGLRTNEYSLLDYIPVYEKSLSIWKNINIQLKELYDNILKENNNEKKISGISSDLNEMKQILEESISDYFICFQYKQEDEIYDAQELFLKIGLLMFEIILKLENEDEQMTVLEIIKNIQIREEFSQTLVNEKWFDYDEENDEYSLSKKILDKKIIHNYFNFTYNCIKFMDKAEKIPLGMQFLSELYVSLYFKFPILRKNILKSITYGVPENFPNKIYIDEEDSKTYPENRILFWDYLTKEKLKDSVEKAAGKTNPEIKNIFFNIKNLVDNEIPFPNLAKRDKFCFNFILNLIHIIMSKLSKNFYHLVNIHWLNIHGFCNIINSLLYELQNKEPSEYPSTIRKVIYPMLNEPKIYVVIINTILFKTNVYDGTSVYFILDLIDDILKEFDKAFNPYQLDLDYNNFYKAVEIIVLTDNSLTLSKLLWLYYSS